MRRYSIMLNLLVPCAMDGSLLDHSMIAYRGGLSGGTAHSPHDLPLLVAAGGIAQVLARYSHKNGTFFASGHSVPAGSEPLG